MKRETPNPTETLASSPVRRRLLWWLVSAAVFLLSVGFWWWPWAGDRGIPAAVTAEEVQRAEGDFRRAERREPERSELLLMLAENLARRGRVEVALACAEQVPVADPQAGLRAGLLTAQFCLRLNLAGRAEQAVQGVLREWGERSRGVESDLRTARELLVFLLSLQFRFEERQVQLLELRKAGLLEPLLTKQLYFPALLAWRTAQQNQRLQQFLEQTPDDARLLAAHARYLLGAGAVDESRRLIDAAATMNPEDPGVLAAALECRFEMQDLAGFRGLLQAAPKYAVGEPWLLTHMRAEAAALGQDWAESARYFEVLLRADETNPLYCQGLARAYGELGRESDRVRLQQRALRLAELRLTLGEAELQTPAALRAAAATARELQLPQAAEDLEQLAQLGERTMQGRQEQRR